MNTNLKRETNVAQGLCLSLYLCQVSDEETQYHDN